MTDDSINQAVAEKLGWIGFQFIPAPYNFPPVLWGKYPPCAYYEVVPDYVNSLDAMRQAELSMNDEELYQYGDILAGEVCQQENKRFGDPDGKIFELNGLGHASLVMTSPRDKALAWLKVKRPDFF